MIYIPFGCASGNIEPRNTENENKRCKIFNKVLNMNWDYVRVKNKQRENKNKQTKRKQTKKNVINILKHFTYSR
jgi:hypothetical protein